MALMHLLLHHPITKHLINLHQSRRPLACEAIAILQPSLRRYVFSTHHCRPPSDTHIFSSRAAPTPFAPRAGALGPWILPNRTPPNINPSTAQHFNYLIDPISTLGLYSPHPRPPCRSSPSISSTATVRSPLVPRSATQD